MIGQVVKRNHILLFQNLAMDMHQQKMQKKNHFFKLTNKQQIRSYKDHQLCTKRGSKHLLSHSKLHHSLTNQEIQNGYVNHDNIQGKCFVK